VSNFAWSFIGVQGKESQSFVNFAAPRSPKLDELASTRAAAPHAYPHVNITAEMHRRKRHARDAPFVKSRGMWT